jgi:hypothetical protein
LEGSRTNRSKLQSEEEVHPSHEFQTKRISLSEVEDGR